MKYIFLLCLSLIVGMNLQAQEERKVIIKEKTITKDKGSKSDKVVTVDVEEEDGARVFTIVTNEDGEEKVMKWKDNGEMPDEVKKQLEEQGIDIQVLDMGNGAMFIGDDSREEIRIRKEIDGEIDEEIDIEWDGEGEMPEQMKVIIEEHDIDLSELRKDGKGAKMRMKMMKKDKMHGPHMKMMKMHGPKGEIGEVKVYMGAQIGPGEGGTGIIDVMVDSPAHKAGLKKGDVITEINGANTKNVKNTMMLLSLFDVNDTVEVTYTRGGKSKTTKLKLAPRPKPYR